MKRVFLRFLFLFFFLFDGFLFAEEEPYCLDDIVVTASRVRTPLLETSGNVTIITEEDIKGAGARTLIDIFEKEPGITTSNLLDSPKRAHVDIRGYGEAAPQNVLFLVDGRRVNSVDLSGTDLSQIAIDMVERVEVYRGPGSVLFGDNAAAGVVNIMLKKGEGRPKATVGASIGSYDFVQSQASISGQEGKFSYFTLASGYGTDGYRHNNSSEARDVFGNFSFDVSENSNVAVKAGHHTDKYELPGALYKRALRDGSVENKDSVYPFDHASTEDNFVDAQGSVKIANLGEITVGGSYRSRNQPSDFSDGSGNFTRNRTRLTTVGFTPRLTIDQPIIGKKSNFTVGWDYYTYPTDVSVRGNYAGIGPSNTGADIDRSDNAFYVNERFYPVDNFLVEAGYRRQKARYDVDYADLVNPVLSSSSVSHQDKEAYRFSANYLLGRKGNIFASYGRGFRFPVTDEFVIPGYCFSGYCQPTEINTSLKPQISDELDVGFRYNPVHYAGGSVTFFRAKNRNEIYYDPILFANLNYDRTTRTGIEASVFFQPVDPLRVTINYSYIKAVFDGGSYNGNDVPLVPRNKLAVKLSYTVLNDFTINFTGVARSNCYMISDQKNEESKLPGYTIFDTSIVWRKGRFMTLFAIKNLTGKKYSENGVYSPFADDVGLYPSPERQFFLSMQYTFGK